MDEQQINQEVAEQICRSQFWNGRQFRLGASVALLGKVVAVDNDLDAALRALRALVPSTERGQVFEVAPPVTDVIR
jgi:hypothetical protein